MRKLVVILFLLVVGLKGFGQKIIDKQFDEDGNLSMENIQFDNDTILEKHYFQNGKTRSTYHLLNNQRNGKSLLYNETGELLFEQFYLNGLLHNSFKSFYPNGNTQRLEQLNKGYFVDTAYYYNEDNSLYRIVIFNKPCLLGSTECDKTIIMYQDNTKVYSYEIKNGWKSNEHEIYNKKLYNSMTTNKNKVSLLEKGKSIFMINCAACHSLKVQIVGPPLNCITKKIKEKEMYELINYSKKHHSSKLSKEDYNALLKYLKTTCN